MARRIATLSEAREEVEAQSRDAWDALAEPGELTLIRGRLVSPRLYRREYPTGLGMNPWATGQACQLLGIPAAYFRRCPVELQDTQFNHWRAHREEERGKEGARRSGSGGSGAQKAEQRWLLRAKGDALRAVLTERYARLDHRELLDALSPALTDHYELDWFALDEESLHLRLHDARLYRDALPGDRLMAGVHVANSEVGKRAVTVDALVYRLVCTNGLIRKVGGASLLRQRHVALSKIQFVLSVHQAVRDALAEGALALERLSRAVAHPIPDVERTLRNLALDWGLTKATEEAAKAAILREPSSQHETLYGLINGLTGAARYLPADERYALEARAGALLERWLRGEVRPVSEAAGGRRKPGDLHAGVTPSDEKLARGGSVGPDPGDLTLFPALP